jgi:hypothetical protein
VASVYSATTEGEEALAAATAETVLLLLGSANVKGRIVEWGVFFDGTSNTAEPVRVRLVRTTAADGTSTGATEKPWDTDANPTSQCAAFHSYTVEPTKEATPLASYEVPPTSGMMLQYPLGREIVLPKVATGGVAIEVTAPAAVNCEAYIVWEE